MAVTQDFINQVAEALQHLSDSLENADMTGAAEFITTVQQITNAISVPGVRYNKAPVVNGVKQSDATAEAYVQIPWSVLSEALAAMQAAVTAAAEDHTTAGLDHARATTQAALMEEWNTHQPYIGDDDYWYIYDTTNDRYVRSVYAKGDDLHYEEMSQAEKEDLARRVLANLVFASVETCESIIDELI